MRALWAGVILILLLLNTACSVDKESSLRVDRFAVNYSEHHTITYELPRIAQIVVPPRNSLHFQEKRPFTLGSEIVRIGLGRPVNELHPAIVDLGVWRFSPNYFDQDFDMEDFQDILTKESFSVNSGLFTVRQLITDTKGRRWLETTVYSDESKQRMLAHAYTTPLTANSILNLRASFKKNASLASIADAQLRVKEILGSVDIK